MVPLLFDYKNIEFKAAYHLACPAKIQPDEKTATSYFILALAYNFFTKKSQKTSLECLERTYLNLVQPY